MIYFFKAVGLSFRYKWTIVLSVLNAMFIAFLWSASISTIYPFVEVVFEGKTMHAWLEDSLTEIDAEEGRLRQEIAGLRQEMSPADPDRSRVLANQIALRETHLAVHDANRRSKLQLQPYIERWGPTSAFGTLFLVIVILILATALKGACLVLSVVLVSRISGGTVVDMRRIFFRKMLNMDQRTLDRIGTTNLMTMLSHNVGLIQAGLGTLYGRSLIEPLKMVSCLLVACAISWQLLLLSLALAPLGFLIIHSLGRRMRSSAGREIDGYAAVFQTLMDTLTGIKLVKIFTRERKERRRFRNNARSLYRMSMRIAGFDALLRPVTELMSILILSIAILSGAYLVLNQQTHILGIRMSRHPLSAAEAFTFFAMLSGIADPARKLADVYNVMVRATMACRGLYQTFDTPPSIAAPAVATRAPLHSASLTFDRVHFGYEPNNPVLRGISLEIPFGQTIALVGVNGCGKSTITNLISRFYDPDSGAVYLDGVNLRDLRPRQLRKQIGIVTQDPVLFRGTVWMNIRYGNPHATDEQVYRAAELAHVTDFITELPRKFQAQVGDRGGFLSGGQRQRVALARAILSDPRIFILDEATSQMDVEAEALVHESLRDFLRQRTTILVTHRPSTLQLADRVIVMRAGRIVEDIPGSQLALEPQAFAALVAKAA